jgi:hypothetical protein
MVHTPRQFITGSRRNQRVNPTGPLGCDPQL